MNQTTQTLLETGTQALTNFELGIAEKSFKDALKQSPSEPKALIAMTRLQLVKSEPKSAMMFAKRAEKQDKTGDALGLLGSCLLQMGEVNKAVSSLQTAHKRFPQHILIMDNLAKALFQQGDFAASTSISQKALAMEKDNADIHFNLGLAATGLHKFDEAIEHYVSALTIRPTFLGAYLQLTQLATMTGKIDIAIKLLAQGTKVLPDVIELREELHTLYIAKGQYKHALGEALMMASQYSRPEDFIRIGNTYLLLGDGDAALEAYEAALEADPNDPAAHMNIAHLYRLGGKRKEAYTHYAFVVEHAPQSYQPYLGIGLLYLELDLNPEKARLVLLQAAELAPAVFDVLYPLAQACYAIGHIEEAGEVLKDALPLCHDASQEQNVLAFLAEINAQQQN